eukprot:8230037-Karenia_brevis.AAC.1
MVFLLAVPEMSRKSSVLLCFNPQNGAHLLQLPLVSCPMTDSPTNCCCRYSKHEGVLACP